MPTGPRTRREPGSLVRWYNDPECVYYVGTANTVIRVVGEFSGTCSTLADSHPIFWSDSRQWRDVTYPVCPVRVRNLVPEEYHAG